MKTAVFTFQCLISLLLLGLNGFSQERSNTFTLEGTVKNFDKGSFSVGISSYLDKDYTVREIKVDNKGNFHELIPIGKKQMIFLMDNVISSFSIPVQIGDVITLEWDHLKDKSSLTIKAKDSVSNSIIQVYKEFNLRRGNANIELFSKLFMNHVVSPEKDDDRPEKRFEFINRDYQESTRLFIQLGDKLSASEMDDILLNNYFDHCDQMCTSNLLPTYDLYLEVDSLKIKAVDTMYVNGRKKPIYPYRVLNQKNIFKEINEEYFTNFYSYRQFLYSYLLSNSTMYRLPETDSIGTDSVNWSMDNYFRAKANIKSQIIRDWFITSILLNDLKLKSFDKVDKVYQLFNEECKNPYFKKILAESYNTATNILPGKMAPEFSLEDETGKQVSLSDFRGKVVLINFGGVYCGPCKDEHSNYLPGLLKNYPNKDLVFIRITVDAKRNEWQNQLKKDALPGEVNLFAKMQGADSVCKSYNIGPIPIYCVVGKNGAILNANAPRPSDMIKNIGHNLIDEALAME